MPQITGHPHSTVRRARTRTFASQNAANSHMNATGHWIPRFKCDVCNLKFQTQNGALQHMNIQMHHSHLYCRDCSRGFQNENNLKMVSQPGPLLTLDSTISAGVCASLLMSISISAQRFIVAQLCFAHSAKSVSRQPAAFLTTSKQAHAPTQGV